MGEVPEWYSVIRAARFVGVPPWEILSRDVAWFNLILKAEEAERQAEKERAKRASRKRNRAARG